MTRLFIQLYRYFSSHRTVCWLTMVALFLFFGFFASQIHLEEDINRLMPSSRNEDGSIKLAFSDLKIKDMTFIIFEGDNTDSIVSTCDAFIDSLGKRDSAAHVIGDVFYRLPDDLMENAIYYLTDHLPSFIDTTAYASIDTMLNQKHMMHQMQQNKSDMESEIGEMYPEILQADPIGIRNILTPPMPSTGNYQTIDNHFFVADSSLCVAFMTPRFSSTNTGQGSQLFEMMNAEIEAFSKSHPDVHISYHGTPASGFYNSTQIKHDLTTTISGALILVLIFIFICFRNLNTIPLLLLPIAFGTLFGLTMMYFIRGEFSLLALGIGGVVLGVAMSYVLHILTHYKYVDDAEQVLRDQVKPVLLGCITTIGSFSALIFIQTDLLRDFGLFAAFAILGTTLFSLAYLPQMINPKKTKVNQRAFALIDRFNSLKVEQNRTIIATVCIATLICIGFYIARGNEFDADMHNLGYEEANTTRSEKLLESKTFTGDKTKYFAAKGKTMEEAIMNFALLDQKLDSLKKLGLVKDYTRTNQIFVPKTVQQQRIDAWKAYWTAERLDKVRTLITQTAPSAGLTANGFEPFFEAATADYEPDALYDSNIIPEGYKSTMMEQSYGGDFLCFTSVRCANDSVRSSHSDYIRICDAIASDPNLMVLDTYYYTTDTLMQMSNDFNRLQWLSMAFVFIVLLFSFKFDWRLTILGFMPILLSWLIVLGAMAIFDMHFNLINIIISTFIFGIGVDYSIFVMNGLEDGNLAYHKTAIFFSAVILVVTVSSMLLAEHPAIESVGFSTLVGLVSAVVLSYVIQPAIYEKLKNKG